MAHFHLNLKKESIFLLSLILFCILSSFSGCRNNVNATVADIGIESSSQPTTQLDRDNKTSDYYIQSLTDNSISRCALGIALSGIAIVPDAIDTILGLFNAVVDGVRYVLETDREILTSLLHWDEATRIAATSRLADKGSAQRDYFSKMFGLFSMIDDAIPAARKIVNAKFGWFGKLPAHHQSEFLCGLIISVPTDILIAIAGTKGLDKLAQAVRFQKYIDELAEVTSADTPSQTQFITEPKDWSPNNIAPDADPEIVEARISYEEVKAQPNIQNPAVIHPDLAKLENPAIFDIDLGAKISGNSGGVHVVPDAAVASLALPYRLLAKEITGNYDDLIRSINYQKTVADAGLGPKIISYGIEEIGRSYRLRFFAEDLLDINQRPSIKIASSTEFIGNFRRLSKSLKIELARKILNIQMRHPDGHPRNVFARLRVDENGTKQVEALAIDLDAPLMSTAEAREFALTTAPENLSDIDQFTRSIKFEALNGRGGAIPQYNFFWNRSRILDDLDLNLSDTDRDTLLSLQTVFTD